MLQDSRSSACNRGSPPTGVPSAPAANPAVIRTIDLHAAASGILNRSPSTSALLPSSIQFVGGDSFNTSRALRDLYTASSSFPSAQFLQQRQSGVNPAANPAINSARLGNPNSSNTNHSAHHHTHNSSSSSPSMAMAAGGSSNNPNQQVLKCPRCDSLNTKFCYYNNYSLLQPRHFCKNCRRYWTKGGALRNVPVGGGCRKNKRSSSSSSSSPSGSAAAASNSSAIANISSSNRSISSNTTSIISNGIAAISSGSQLSSKRHLYIPEHQNHSNNYLINNSTTSSGNSLFNPAMNSVLLASAQDYATSMGLSSSTSNLSSPSAGANFSSLTINNSANLYRRLNVFGDPNLYMQQRQPTFMTPGGSAQPDNSAIAAAAAQLTQTDTLQLSSYNGFNTSPGSQSNLLDQIRRRSPQLNLPTQSYCMLQSGNDSFTDGSRAVMSTNPISCNINPARNTASGKVSFSFNFGNPKQMSAAGITSDGQAQITQATQATVSCSSSSSSTSNPVQDFASFGALNLTTSDLTGFAGASSSGLDRLINSSSTSTVGAPAATCRDQPLQGCGFGQLADYHTDNIRTHDQGRLDQFLHGDLGETDTADPAAASNLISPYQLIQSTVTTKNAEDDQLESLQGKMRNLDSDQQQHHNNNNVSNSISTGASDADQAAAAASIVINGDDDDDQNVWSHAATAGGSAQDGFLGPSTDSSSFWNSSASAWPDHHHLQCGYGSSTT